MFYIPDEWIVDKKNKDTISSILNKYLYTDLISEYNEDNLGLALEELKRIGETIVIKKLEDGTIKVN